MHNILSIVAKRIYARITGLSWDAVIVFVACHFAISWGMIALAGGEKIAEGGIFWYYYATTATTAPSGNASWTGRRSGSRVSEAFLKSARHARAGAP